MSNPPSRERGASMPGGVGVVGVISDTHGLLRPEALAALTGCQRIVHAGDLGKVEVFEQLSKVAPTIAIRGNVDRGDWAKAFPKTRILSVFQVKLYVLHDLHELSFDPVVKKIDVVISGHSHRPVLKKVTGVLYVNPGSAGPRRFSLPVTVARLKITHDHIQAELVDVLGNLPISTLTTVPGRASA